MNDKGFVEYVVGDLFGYLSDVSARAMFGGYGVYRNGVMFGLVADGELYFKVNESQKNKYEAFGSKAFTYMKEGRAQEMMYFYIPEEIQENSELFRELAEESYELALEKAVKNKKTSKDNSGNKSKNPYNG